MKRKNWKIYVGALVLAVVVVFIVRSLLAGPSTAPRAKDRATAQGISTAAGAADERAVVPREGLIAGNAVVEPRDRETKVAAAVSGRIAAIHRSWQHVGR